MLSHKDASLSRLKKLDFKVVFSNKNSNEIKSYENIDFSTTDKPSWGGITHFLSVKGIPRLNRGVEYIWNTVEGQYILRYGWFPTVYYNLFWEEKYSIKTGLLHFAILQHLITDGWQKFFEIIFVFVTH